MKKFEIWREGYAVTGNISEAELIGNIQAENFEQAVIQYYVNNPSKTFDTENLTDWGLRHFDNEQDARRSFG